MSFTTFLIFMFISYYVNSYQMILLCGFLSSVFFGICSLNLLNVFIPFSDSFQFVKLVMGLFTFCGFVTYDTYLMHQKFHSGNYNYYVHAQNLFFDFINLFTNFLQIFTSKPKGKKKPY